MTFEPFNCTRSRDAIIIKLHRYLDVSTMANDIQRQMLYEFMSTLDMEQYAPQLQFADSYTTLHSYALGDEILKQTDIEKRFESFAGAGRIKELFCGEDEILSGSMMSYILDRFANELENSFKNKSYRSELIRDVSALFKSTNWWKANCDRVSKILQKNRNRLNHVKSVQMS